jgi:uncharacterized coiled-coil protein SlyX
MPDPTSLYYILNPGKKSALRQLDQSGNLQTFTPVEVSGNNLIISYSTPLGVDNNNNLTMDTSSSIVFDGSFVFNNSSIKMTGLGSAVTSTQLYIDASGKITKGAVSSGGGGGGGGNSSSLISSVVSICGDIVNISGGAINLSGPLNYSSIPINTSPINFFQFQQTIRPTLESGYTGNVYFGISTFISPDGNTMAVGSPQENRVRVYSRSGTTWTQQGNAISPTQPTPTSSGAFGGSISLSYDGNLMAVSSPDESSNIGAVRIFTRNTTTLLWSQLGNAITPTQPTPTGNVYFGQSVSFSYDGNTLAVGGYYENSRIGSVRVYTRNGSSWNLQQYITPEVFGEFGGSVSLSSDGNTMAVGASNENSAYGAVRIYTRSNSTWTLQQTINGFSYDSYFGFSVSISSDGTTLAVGTLQEYEGLGSARVFTRSGSTWTQQGGVFAPTSPTAYGSVSFGSKLRISPDGNKLVAAALNENSGVGAVRIFSRTGTTWMQTQYITPISYVGNAQFGYSIAISSDGNTISLGAYNENNGIGAVSVYYNSPQSASLNLGDIKMSGNIDLNGVMNCNSINISGVGTTSGPAPLSYSLYGYMNSTSFSAYLYYPYIYPDTISLSVINSIKTNTQIYAQTFFAYSDSRIKTNIVDIDDGNALSILRKIKPKTYDYIDKIKKGNANVIGFIAQEIKEIIPKAVSITNDYVPNFYTICQISHTDVSNIALVTSPIDLSWNPLHDQSGNEMFDGSGNVCSDVCGNQLFNVKFYNHGNTEIKCKTTSILDKRNFLIDITGTIINPLEKEYFLYGQEVDDFHNIDKPSIFTVVTAAVQDIDRIQQVHDAQIQEQNVQIQASLTQIQAQAGQIQDLQNTVAQQQTQIAQQQTLIAQQQTLIAQQQTQIAALEDKVSSILAKLG